MINKLTFDIYRFSLIPTSSNQIDLNFEEFKKQFSYEELKEVKNDIFYKVLLKLNINNDDFKINIFSKTETSILFGFANLKETILDIDFKQKQVVNEPYVWVIINTDPKYQKIAISRNYKAFSKTSTTKNILVNLFQRHLSEFGLSVEIEAIFEKKNFWELTKKYKGKIKELDFEIIKPNMSDISKTIKDSFKPLIESTNSHKTHIKLEAPTGGVLENIDKDNEKVNEVIDYVSEGGGNVSIKVQGISRTITTKKTNETISINEIEIKSSADQVIKIWEEIVKK